MPRDEVEAAYFALLRAEDEVADLRRYHEVLLEEARRLRRFRSEGEALLDQAPAKLRRRLAHTDAPLHEAIKARLAFLEDELARLPARQEAAEAFVASCRAEHERLKRTG
jgi:hypothetical protein